MLLRPVDSSVTVVGDVCVAFVAVVGFVPVLFVSSSVRVKLVVVVSALLFISAVAVVVDVPVAGARVCVRTAIRTIVNDNRTVSVSTVWRAVHVFVVAQRRVVFIIYLLRTIYVGTIVVIAFPNTQFPFCFIELSDVVSQSTVCCNYYIFIFYFQ